MTAPAATAVEITVTVTYDAWLAACPDAEALAERAARAALAAASPPATADRPLVLGPMAVGIVLTDDAEQRVLNRTWRGKDSATNVLSFALAGAAEPAPPPGAPVLLGDVVLAFETVAREAAEQHKTLADHLAHLVVHGVLHLMGFDHESDAEATAMETRETAILAELGLASPYDEPI
jgi:probable rRNA maturation factor